MLQALYVEINVIGVCLLMIILFNQQQDVGSSTLKRSFNHLIYATIAMLITDTACWLLDGAAFPQAHVYKVLAESVYYAFNIGIPFLWVLYVEIAISRELKATYRKLKWLAFPMLLLLLFIIINLFTGSIFTVDENNVYTRNIGFYAFAVIAYVYLIYATVRAVQAARRAGWKEDRRRYYTLAFFMAPPGIAGIIQIFVYGLSLIWVFVTIAIMLMYIDSLNRQISADPLTGINNRRELRKYILKETKDPSYDGLLALIMMDVDNFKRVNDEYGHFYGDDVLMRVSEILKHSCKDTPAFLARYGGDEFCIVYPAKNLQAVDSVISGILRNVIRWNTMSSDTVKIGLSIGYSVWQKGADDTVDDFFRRADEKMYEVKSEKKKIE